MKEFAANYIKTYESLNKWVKFILNFLWGVPTNLYRFAKSAKKDDMLGMIVAVILLVTCGCWLLAVIDLITIATGDKVYWLDDFMTSEPTVGDAKPEEKKEGEADKID